MEVYLEKIQTRYYPSRLSAVPSSYQHWCSAPIPLFPTHCNRGFQANFANTVHQSRDGELVNLARSRTRFQSVQVRQGRPCPWRLSGARHRAIFRNVGDMIKHAGTILFLGAPPPLRLSEFSYLFCDRHCLRIERSLRQPPLFIGRQQAMPAQVPRPEIRTSAGSSDQPQAKKNRHRRCGSTRPCPHATNPPAARAEAVAPSRSIRDPASRSRQRACAASRARHTPTITAGVCQAARQSIASQPRRRRRPTTRLALADLVGTPDRRTATTTIRRGRRQVRRGR